MLTKSMLASIALVYASAVLGTPAFATCYGADPAITSVAVTSKTTDNGLNQYHLTGKVTNVGHMAQASNLLEFVDIYKDGERLDDRGILPLKPGQSYTFGYTLARSADAGDGTTTLTFQLRFRQPSPPGKQDCDETNDTYVLSF